MQGVRRYMMRVFANSGFRRGFTLIELLIVITILAILAGAALPYVQSYVNESRISKAKADLDEIGRALAIYETREREYMASDVSLLTGRYLNKAPIDPWGQAYKVDGLRGLVYSAGADRIPANEDDITFPYQPALALVQAKWVDVNQTGAVDTQNSTDTLLLIFSRRVKTGVSSIDATKIRIFRNGADEALNANAVLWSSAQWLASRTLAIGVNPTPAGGPAFTPGSDTIQIAPNSAIYDMGNNQCMSAQPVTIVAQ